MKSPAPCQTPIVIAMILFLFLAALRILPEFTPKSKSLNGFDFDLVQRVEWITYDWRIRFARPFAPPADTNLGAVYIDDASLTAVSNGSLGYYYGLYWPRHIYGQLIRELTRQGVKAIAFDVLFGELRSDHKAFKDLVLTNRAESPDDFFVRQMRTSGHVILASTEDVAPPLYFRTNAMALGDISSEKDSDGVPRRMLAFIDYPKPLWHPEILDLVRKLDLDLKKAKMKPGQILIPRTDGEADYEVPLNPDGTLDMSEFDYPKDTPPQKPLEFVRVWNLGIALAAAQLNLDLARAVVDLPHGRIVLPGPNGLERVIPVDRTGRLLINWSLARPGTEDAIHHLLDKDLNPPDPGEEPNPIWKDKLVIVGSVATGSDLTDLGPTPLQKGETFLMSKYWNVANSILQGRFIREGGIWVELVLIAALGCATAVAIWSLPVLWGSIVSLVLAVAYAMASVAAFTLFQYALPMTLPIFGGVGLFYVAILSCRVIFEQKERQRIRSVFSRIVSPEVVDELLAAEDLSLRGTRRQVTVLFADVRGFTEFTDTSQAQAENFARDHKLLGRDAEAYIDEHARNTLTTVNLYLGIVAQAVKKHRGTLDKYIGDCVMAFWGAPIHNEDHAICCIRAAIEAQQAIAVINEERVAENRRIEERNAVRAQAGQPPLPPLPVLLLGIGINTGKVNVGLMGSDLHGLNYTVFGREVNVASRLEGASGMGRILISSTTCEEIRRQQPDFAKTCSELPPITVKGIRQPVKIFEVHWRESGTASSVPSSTVGNSRP